MKQQLHKQKEAVGQTASLLKNLVHQAHNI